MHPLTAKRTDVLQAGPAALEISVRSDEEESHRVAKWNSGIRLALEKGSSRAHLRNCYVDIMQSAGLDAQTSTKAADSLVGGTAKCATVSGERKILSFSQFGEAFRILLGYECAIAVWLRLRADAEQGDGGGANQGHDRAWAWRHRNHRRVHNHPNLRLEAKRNGRLRGEVADPSVCQRNHYSGISRAVERNACLPQF